jgi:hypothetical protein
MSRRTRRRDASPPPVQAPAEPEPRERASREWTRGLAGQIAFLAAVFAAATLIAELAGAANLGVALGVGQIAFAIALVAVLVRW